MNSTKYKYEIKIQSICNCPRDPYYPIQTKGYRMVNANQWDKKNYLPRNIKFNNSHANNSINCTDLALSFYISEKKLLAVALNSNRYGKNLYKKLGDHFVEIALDQFSGMQSKPSSSGHFDLYEFINFDCINSVKSFQKIMP